MHRCALSLIRRSDAGMSKGNSHSLLKRTTSQHSATSRGASVDLSSTIRLKKAGLASSDGILKQCLYC
jgi:PERQ amino acid-rich with GYF domain-containing protein